MKILHHFTRHSYTFALVVEQFRRSSGMKRIQALFFSFNVSVPRRTIELSIFHRIFCDYLHNTLAMNFLARAPSKNTQIVYKSRADMLRAQMRKNSHINLCTLPIVYFSGWRHSNVHKLLLRADSHHYLQLSTVARIPDLVACMYWCWGVP